MYTKVGLSKLNKEQLVDVILRLQGGNVSKTVSDTVLGYFNDNSNLPKVIKLTDSRKHHLTARIKEYGLDAVYEMIDTISKSDFLRYGGGTWRGANWDWVFNPNNFVKILEGNYNNKDTNTALKERVDLI